MIFLIPDGTNPQQGSENREPLPNPWGPRSTGAPPGTAANAPNPQGLLNTPGMQSLLQQMSENPHLIQSMLNAPYFQSVIQAFQADPTMASQIINQVSDFTTFEFKT